MVCSGCGAHLIDGTKKCPFCKEILGGNINSNMDVTYKIDSEKQFELIKSSSRANISHKKFDDRRKRRARKRMIGYAILLFIAALFIAIIVGIISLFAYLFSDKTVYTTTYYTENEIGLRYNDETYTLTTEVFDADTRTLRDTSIGFKGMVSKSKNGKVTAFLDKFNASGNQGSLKAVYKSNADDAVLIADNVSPWFKISDDGKYIVFIKNATAKGNMGELWIYEKGGEPIKIADKVDVDRFIFSEKQDRIIYLKGYDYKSRFGTAYYAEIGDYAENKLCENVHRIFGTSKDSEKLLFCRDFNKEKMMYDVFVHNGKEEIPVVMNCGAAPQFSENKEYAFVCGDKSGDRFSLYRVDFKSLKAEKIINNMSKISRISEDGEKVIYSKLFDNNVADYYIWKEGETELKVADGVNYTKENQVAVSDDFKKVAYIANYIEDKNGGSLYHCEYDGDYVTVPEKISDDVYSCFVLNDNKFVYTKNYSSRAETAELFMFDKMETEVSSEVNPKFLSVDEYILCLYDYSDNNGGNLFRIDSELSETKITTDVFEYYLKDNGEITLSKSYNQKTGKFDLYETEGDSVKLIKKDVENVIFY